MDSSMFQAIIGSLSRWRYEGWLAFHNYNEPLANPRITQEVALARGQLPNAKLAIYTNGDYLTSETLEELVAAGLTQMRVTVYPRASCDGAPSHGHLWQWLEKKAFLRRGDWSEAFLRQGPALVRENPVAIELISPDVSRYYDRGGMLPVLSIPHRSTPCFLTSHSLSIDYLGNIKMCCNMVTGHAPHERYMFGNVKEYDPIDLWNSPHFTQVRWYHRRARWTGTPICVTCRQEVPQS